MIYHLAQSSEYYTLTHAEDNISPSSSGNDLVAAADNKWSGFEANTPNTGRYSLTGSYTSKTKQQIVASLFKQHLGTAQSKLLLFM